MGPLFSLSVLVLISAGSWRICEIAGSSKLDYYQIPLLRSFDDFLAPDPRQTWYWRGEPSRRDEISQGQHGFLKHQVSSSRAATGAWSYVWQRTPDQ